MAKRRGFESKPLPSESLQPDWKRQYGHVANHPEVPGASSVSPAAWWYDYPQPALQAHRNLLGLHAYAGASGWNLPKEMEPDAQPG